MNRRDGGFNYQSFVESDDENSSRRFHSPHASVPYSDSRSKKRQQTIPEKGETEYDEADAHILSSGHDLPAESRRSLVKPNYHLNSPERLPYEYGYHAKQGKRKLRKTYSIDEPANRHGLGGKLDPSRKVDVIGKNQDNSINDCEEAVSSSVVTTSDDADMCSSQTGLEKEETRVIGLTRQDPESFFKEKYIFCTKYHYSVPQTYSYTDCCIGVDLKKDVLQSTT
jgi:hypothetical protein